MAVLWTENTVTSVVSSTLQSVKDSNSFDLRLIRKQVISSRKNEQQEFHSASGLGVRAGMSSQKQDDNLKC